MKIKPLYIYSSIIILAIVFLIVSSRESGSSNSMNNPHGNMMGDEANKGMPNDDVHKGLSGSGNPSGGNVSDNIKHMMAKMEEQYKANPDDTLKAREYADFLTSAHQSDKAIPIYEKLLDKAPKRTDIRFALAYIYFTRQDFGKSEQVINQVLAYDKNNLHAKFNKGLILVTRGEKEKGKALWQEVVNASPNSSIASKTKEALKELK